MLLQILQFYLYSLQRCYGQFYNYFTTILLQSPQVYKDQWNAVVEPSDLLVLTEMLVQNLQFYQYSL